MRPLTCPLLSSLLALSALLTGCSLTSPDSPSSFLEPGPRLSGYVHGGQQPISGAHVYVIAAGTSGYGGASPLSLLTTGIAGSDSFGGYVTTSSTGFWSVTGDYTCTSGSQMYILATQGNPGLGLSGNNPNAALMAALGTCPSNGSLDGPYPTVYINEVTTVASVYALSGFMTDIAHISSSNTALGLTGVANAFANVANLVNLSTGIANANTVLTNGNPNPNGTVPQSTINTLADILAACINSAGGVAGDGSACGTLFANALNGSTAPTDTVTAALNIAHNPAANVPALFGIATANSPFAPSLATAPGDFTLSLTFTDSSLNAPAAIAIDGSGNAWIANSGAGSVTEFSPLGIASSYTAGGITNPVGIAVDASGNVWTANTSTVSEISPSGSAVGTSPYTGTVTAGHSFQPRGIAFDESGNAWVSNFGSGENGSLFEFNGSGVQQSPANGYGFAFGIDTSVAVAMDPLGGTPGFPMNVDTYIGGIDEFTDSGTGLSPAGGWGQSINSPEALAVDNSGDAWVADHGSSVIELTFTFSTTTHQPTAATSHSFTGGGVSYGQAIAIDGLGNVWVPNTTFSSTPGVLSEFSKTGVVLSPSGFASTSTINPTGVAVDGSGDVWTCNNYTNFSNDSTTFTATEFIGAAAPVVTPLAAGLKNGNLATRP